MNTFHPSTPSHFAQRQDLLQSALRPDPLPFGIEDEFPIVLSRTQTDYSYCATQGERIVAHFNLWPRQFVSGDSSFRIGLIGNVATDAEFRGQGIMSRCFASIDEIAEQQRLDALILWSDLHSFYQKLDFDALGKELRFTFNRRAEKVAGSFLPVPRADLTIELVTLLLQTRYPIQGTLARTPSEMLQLLHIPETHLFAKIEDQSIQAFGIVGKGYDMGGVIHEWGATNPELLAAMAHEIAAGFDWPATMVLAPGQLDSTWDRQLTAIADIREEHPMALVKTKNSALRRCLESGFIWGLDSI